MRPKLSWFGWKLTLYATSCRPLKTKSTKSTSQNVSVKKQPTRTAPSITSSGDPLQWRQDANATAYGCAAKILRYRRWRRWWRRRRVWVVCLFWIFECTHASCALFCPTQFLSWRIIMKTKNPSFFSVRRKKETFWAGTLLKGSGQC